MFENLGSYGLYILQGLMILWSNQYYPAYLPKLLQIIRPPLLEGVSSVSQDFYTGLKKSLEKLKVVWIDLKNLFWFSGQKWASEVIKTAFTEFCTENEIVHQIEKKVSHDLITKGSAFWVIEDSDLISLIKIGEEMGFRIGYGGHPFLQ